MHLPLLGEVDGIERKNTLYENCQYFLNSEELTEWARVRQDAYKETAKADRLVARAYLRSVLARYSGDMESANGVFLSSKELVKEPQSLQLGANAHGKPRLYTEASQKRVPGNCGAPSRLEFNLSHSHGIIGVAVSYMDSVGLDVEHGKRKMKKDVDMKLARRYFSPTEQEMLQAVPPGEDRNALFLKLWTLKEAYVKAVGRGIGAPPGLKSFSFSFLDSSSTSKGIRFEASQSEPQASWQFHLMQPTDSHIAAVCHQSSSKGGMQPHAPHQTHHHEQEGYMYMFKTSTFGGCHVDAHDCTGSRMNILASGSS